MSDSEKSQAIALTRSFGKAAIGLERLLYGVLAKTGTPGKNG